MRITCRCGFVGEVPSSYAGKQVRCRRCQAMIAVPALGAPNTPPAQVPTPVLSTDPTPADSPFPFGEAGRKPGASNRLPAASAPKKWLFVGLAAGVSLLLGLIAVAAFAVVQLSSGQQRAQQQPLATAANVAIGQKQGQRANDGEPAQPRTQLNAKQPQISPLNAKQKALWQKFREKRTGYLVAGYSRHFDCWVLHGATPLEAPSDSGGLVGPVDVTVADIYAKEWTKDTPATAVLNLFSREEPVIVHCYVDTRKGRVKCDRPPGADLEAALHRFIREQQFAAISKEGAPNPSEGAILVCLAVARAADPADAIIKQLTAKESSSRLKAAKAVQALGGKGAKYDYALVAAMAKDYPKDREVYLEALGKSDRTFTSQ